jgi:regulator of replication initiation timing
MGRLNGKSAMTEQAYRYPKDAWSASEARSHCSEHGGRFEAARDTKAQSDIDKTIVKEVKDMELEVRVQELETEISGLKLQLVARDDLVTNLTAENGRLDKELTILKANAKTEKEAQAAETIMSDVLSQSTLAEGFYVKVKALVKPGDYKTEAGDFNEATFRTAFSAEVADWVKNIRPATGGIGLTDTQTDGDGNIDADMELGRELARSVSGKIRSDG